MTHAITILQENKYMNTNVIKNFVSKNRLAEIIFTSWALRQRNRLLLNLETFRRVLEEMGIDVNTQEFIDVFHFLQNERVGQIVKNDSGVYFKCFIPLRDIAFIGLGEKPFDSGETRNRSLKKKPIVRKQIKTVTVLTDITIGVPLTSGETVTLNIQKGINKNILTEIVKKLEVA